jgi:beta-lactamase class D
LAGGLWVPPVQAARRLDEDPGEPVAVARHGEWRNGARPARVLPRDGDRELRRRPELRTLERSDPVLHRLATVTTALLLAACTAGAPPGNGDAAAGDTGGARAAAEAPRPPADTVVVDMSHIFGELTGTMVVFDARGEHLLRHNPARAGERLLPASTFKIPHTLIALETGVATGPDFGLSRDSVRAPRQPWWPSVWAQDHTLRTALPASVVWYYQELARRIGPERMREYRRRFDYGNADIGGGIDQFWLTGDLRISTDEQVAFLRRFLGNALGVSPRTAEIARDLLVLEETPDYRLSGKTGWAGVDIDGPEIGWLVGWLERDGRSTSTR